MKRTWRDNPKKNPAARRKRPVEVVEMRRRNADKEPEPTVGFRTKLGEFVTKFWYRDGVEHKHRSRSKYNPH